MLEDALDVFSEALAQGYRLFDLAREYGNEHILGHVLQQQQRQQQQQRRSGDDDHNEDTLTGELTKTFYTVVNLYIAPSFYCLRMNKISLLHFLCSAPR